MFPSNKTIAYPLFIIGIVMIICGFRWLVHPDPWLLDEVANVERLGKTFDEVFAESTSTIPDYLRQIYRFFGLWVSIIGFFIISFSSPKLTSQEIIRKRLLFCMGIMMVMGTILGYALIPSSHFIYLMWIMNILYLFCIYNHSKINHE